MEIVLRWMITLAAAAVFGKLITRLKMPAILGWLIAGMIFGPHALQLLPQSLLEAGWYKQIISWMQCAFGLMLGTELIWKKIRTSGKALVITTLAQSLGTFTLVSLTFSSLRIKKQGEVKNFCRSHPAGPRRIGLAQSSGKSTLPTKE